MLVLLNTMMYLAKCLSFLVELQVLMVLGLHWLLCLIDLIPHPPLLRHLVAAVEVLSPVSAALACVLDGFCLKLQSSCEAPERTFEKFVELCVELLLHSLNV